MADTKISALTSGGAIQATDEVPVNRAGANVKVTVALGLFDAYAYYRDEETAGTNGGTLSSGSFVKMPLNTEVFDPDGIGTLSSSQVTLQAGTYLLEASSPGVLDGVNSDSVAVLKIRDVTNSADVALGAPMTVWAVSGSSGDGAAVTVRGRVTISGATTFEVQKRVSTTMTTYGWGRAANLGVTEVFGQLMVYREV